MAEGAARFARDANDGAGFTAIAGVELHLVLAMEANACSPRMLG